MTIRTRFRWILAVAALGLLTLSLCWILSPQPPQQAGNGVVVWHSIALKTGALSLTILAIMLLMARSATHALVPPIRKLTKRMTQVACETSGSATANHLLLPPLPEEGESAELFGSFNLMIAHMQKRESQHAHRLELLESELAVRAAELRANNLALKSTNGILGLHLAASPSIFITLDRQGRIRRWNEAAMQLFGLPFEKVFAAPIDNCGILWMNAEMKQEIASWLSAKEPRNYESLAYEVDGQLRFLELQVLPISDEMSAEGGFLLTGTDITEQRNLREQLLRSLTPPAITLPAQTPGRSV